ncbi:MAG: YceI family protein [Pseudomonadota bacterium]
MVTAENTPKTIFMRQLIHLFVLMTCISAAPVVAAPESYTLDMDQSVVGFTYQFQGNPRQGRMPVSTAVMDLDLDNIARSRVTVTLNAAQANAGALFMTSTMKGPNVLNTKAHPTIKFTSTKIEGSLRGAKVTGDLTIRGVTRPVTMTAGLYRQQGTERTDRSRLIVQLLGSVSRSAFGANGFPGFVADQIDLNIIAYIEK